MKLRLYKGNLSLGGNYCCDGIALNDLGKAGNFLGTGHGIVLVLLGRRIVDGKPGVQGKARAPAQSSIVQRR